MKMNLKKLSAMALLVTSFAAMPLAVTASGIPVVDGAAAAQRAQNFFQQMMEMAKQLAQMKQQYEQQVQQYKAMTGSRNMGNLFEGYAQRPNSRPSGARFIKAQKISTISL